jgi:glycosyltransferase involved in cell wall biosynthesis
MSNYSEQRVGQGGIDGGEFGGMSGQVPLRRGNSGAWSQLSEYLQGDSNPGSQGSLDPKAVLAEEVKRSGMSRIRVVAWRDLDDPEAGGSELHAHKILERWASAGLSVSLRTSKAEGKPAVGHRSGYQVMRSSGRYGVFPSVVLGGMKQRRTNWDATVEIWNGMPFFSPLWASEPRVVFLHHVHAEMWDMVLPKPLAKVGYFVESRLAPPFYKRSRIVTLSDSSKQEIVSRLGIPAEHVVVVPPGIDEDFRPGNEKTPWPSVLAVGRLVPVKRFDMLIEALCALKVRHPDLKATIVGEGYLRDDLLALARAKGADSWLSMPGKVTREELLTLYQSSWVLSSASSREGWGMTITEAAACGTPAVVTRTVGHCDALQHGKTGLLVEGVGGLLAGLDGVLSHAGFRRRLGQAALSSASRLSWDATALATFRVLARQPGARLPGASLPGA